MDAHPGASINKYFAKIEDPRIDRTKLHKLTDILVIAICAVVCGADNWEEVQLFGEAKEAWFKTFLELPNGIPSHDTFWRVFARLDPQQFQQSFVSWIASVSEVTKGQVVAIDGKTLRRSHDKAWGRGAIDMVSWLNNYNLRRARRCHEGSCGLFFADRSSTPNVFECLSPMIPDLLFRRYRRSGLHRACMFSMALREDPPARRPAQDYCEEWLQVHRSFQGSSIWIKFFAILGVMGLLMLGVPGLESLYRAVMAWK
mgnify:CR=1 FL=1